jgi:cytochrome c
MIRGKFLALVLVSAALVASGPALAGGDPAEGEKVFKKHLCFGCHKLEPGKNAVGPSLAGFWGREAGKAEGFKNYSKELKESGIVWNEETIDQWVQNPKAMVEKTKMLLPKPVKDEQARADLIAYLKQETSE